MKIGITGWYGHGNIGDELLVHTIAAAVKREIPRANIILLPMGHQRFPLGIEYPTAIPFVPPARLLSYRGMRATIGYAIKGGISWFRHVRDVTVIVVGGGSLLHDRYPGNLEMWERFVRFHKRAGRTVFFYGSGLGPFSSAKSIELLTRILNLIDGMTLRDSFSAELACKISQEGRFILAADPVFNCELIRGKTVTADETHDFVRIGFNMRPLTNVPTTMIEAMGTNLATQILNHGPFKLFFIPMMEDDLELAQRIKVRLPRRVVDRFVVFPHLLNLQDHVNLYLALDAVIAMRLHAMIVAALLGLPVVGLDCDPKTAGFLQDVGLDRYKSTVSDGVHWSEVGAQEIIEKLEHIIKVWPDTRKEVASRLESLKRRERKNIQTLQRILNLEPTGDDRNFGSP